MYFLSCFVAKLFDPSPHSHSFPKFHLSHLYVMPQYLIADDVFTFYVKGSDFVLIAVLCLWARM